MRPPPHEPRGNVTTFTKRRPKPGNIASARLRGTSNLQRASMCADIRLPPICLAVASGALDNANRARFRNQTTTPWPASDAIG